MAVCNIVGLYRYGAKDSLLRLAWREGRSKQNAEEEMEDPASRLVMATLVPILMPFLLRSRVKEASSKHATYLLPSESKLQGGNFYENYTHQKPCASTGVTLSHGMALHASC